MFPQRGLEQKNWAVCSLSCDLWSQAADFYWGKFAAISCRLLHTSIFCWQIDAHDYSYLVQTRDVLVVLRSTGFELAGLERKLVGDHLLDSAPTDRHRQTDRQTMGYKQINKQVQKQINNKINNTTMMLLTWACCHRDLAKLRNDVTPQIPYPG